jgi:signal transduction histidine kinase
LSRDDLIDRLAAHRLLGSAPRAELEWFVERSTLRHHKAGEIIAPATRETDSLWALLSGHTAILVDRGSGPRKVMEWRAGDLAGTLPFSRMKIPPGDGVAIEDTEALELHRDHFPELIRNCYYITATCVHVMLDRARHFTTTDFHDEKMQSLGRLAAGLAHELNNPTSAVSRNATVLPLFLAEVDRAARALGTACLKDAQLAAIETFRSAMPLGPASPLSAIDRADREDAIAGWLSQHGLDEAAASSLVPLPDATRRLEELRAALDPSMLRLAVHYVAVEYEARKLGTELERAAFRISSLVSAVKRFTYLDQAGVPKPVDVGLGLRDTLTMLAAKARAKSIDVSLDLQADLPSVSGYGGELNQVWLNLIENAIDAAPSHGRVSVAAARNNQAVVVRVIDDGPGIPDAIRTRIFDPFYTTKPPGEGTGLGLDIARRLVYRHEGDIEVLSEPGRTEFRVSIPLMLAQREGPPSTRDRE